MQRDGRRVQWRPRNASSLATKAEPASDLTKEKGAASAPSAAAHEPTTASRRRVFLSFFLWWLGGKGQGDWLSMLKDEPRR